MNKVSVYIIILFLLFTLAISCKGQMTSTTTKETRITMSIRDTLLPPFSTKSVTNFSKVIGWKEGQTPKALDGFTSPLTAIFLLLNSAILKGIQKIGTQIALKIKTQHVGESANRITLFRDSNKDGVFESRHVFLEGLNQPFGMLILNNKFYVGNTDARPKDERRPTS